MKRIAGYLILLAVFGILFAMLGFARGWLVAVAVWSSALGLTALTVLAVLWITHDE